MQFKKDKLKSQCFFFRCSTALNPSGVPKSADRPPEVSMSCLFWNANTVKTSCQQLAYTVISFGNHCIGNQGTCPYSQAPLARRQCLIPSLAVRMTELPLQKLSSCSEKTVCCLRHVHVSKMLMHAGCIWYGLQLCPRIFWLESVSDASGRLHTQWKVLQRHVCQLFQQVPV